MNAIPSTTSLIKARAIVQSWGELYGPHDHLGAELVAVCIVQLSRRLPNGWTGRDLLTETTFPRHKFEPSLLRDNPLEDGYFNASRADMANVLAIAQFLIMDRPEAEGVDQI